MCKKPKAFIQLEVEGEAKSKVKPMHSAQVEEILRGKKLMIPCGKCAYCMMQYSNQWAHRCSLEAKQYKENYFITLTYDNENLPRQKKINDHTGEIEEYNSLNKEHLKKFIKGIRNYYYRKYKHTGIKFLACGEYGEKGGRPHYHLIMFNLPMEDLKPKFINKKGEQYWTSETIENIWKKGLTIATEYSWNTGEYIARYLSKRADTNWDANYYKDRRLVKEYITMSNGIGKKYLEENKEEILDNDKVMINQKGTIIYPKTFKYFLRLLEEKYGEEERVKEIKAERERKGLERIEKAKLEGIHENTIRASETYYAEKKMKERINGYEDRQKD